MEARAPNPWASPGIAGWWERMGAIRAVPRARRRGISALRLLATMLVVTGGVSGCTTDGAGVPPSGLQWKPCEDVSRDECATVLVPLRYEDPSGPKFELPLVRVSSADPAEKIGTLMVFLAGTGSAVDQLRRNRALLILSPDAMHRFDVVTFDRRGAKLTAPFTCVDDAWVEESRALASPPVDDADWVAVDAVESSYMSRCAGDYEPAGWLGSDEVAQDIESVRQALGEPSITVLSHRSMALVLAQYARMYPQHVRAIAIDGTVPVPAATALDWYLRRAEGREAMLMEFFDYCAADPSCSFHGGESAVDIASAYDALQTQLRTTPLDVGGRLLRSRDMATAVAMLLTHTPPLKGGAADFAVPLADALAAAESGDGGPLLDDADIATLQQSDGTYDMVRISQSGGMLLADHPCPPGFDLDEARTYWEGLATTAPRLGAVLMEHTLVCAYATGRSAPLDVSAPDSPPWFLGGGTHDWDCSVDCALEFASALGNASEVVSYDGYGGSPMLGRSACYRNSLFAYLIDPESWTPPAQPCTAP